MNDSACSDEGLAEVLEQTAALFRNASDAPKLAKQRQEAALIIRHLDEVVASGEKQVLKAMQVSRDSPSEEELEAVRSDIARIGRERENVRGNLKEARERLANASTNTAMAREEEARLEAEYQKLGGEQEAKRREQAAQLAEATPMLRKAIALNQHVTKIKWDLTAPDNELKGIVLDKAGGRAIDFRITGSSEFEMANRVWSIIG